MGMNLQIKIISLRDSHLFGRNNNILGNVVIDITILDHLKWNNVNKYNVIQMYTYLNVIS